MKKMVAYIATIILLLSAFPAFAQTNSTAQDFHLLQQQKNQNSSPLSYAVFYITENDKCNDSEYQSLKFYQVVSDEYLSLYGVSHDLQGSLCVPLKNYQSYFSGLSTFTLPIVISDNAVGQQLVQQGFYGMYEISGTGKQAIYVCSCDANVESWAGAWILSHELSHFALRYFGEPDAVAVSWVHYIQALENDCQGGNFAKICPAYSASVTSPSGNLVPVMLVYGQGPSSSLPKNAPQSEAAVLGINTITPASHPSCQAGQICALPGDYVTYHVSRPDLDQTVRFDFVSPTDNKNITVKTTILENGSSASEYDTLDLSKGVFTRPNGQMSNFMYILPVPMHLNDAYSKDHVMFANYDRNIMSAQNNNKTNSILVQIDNDTGILVNLALSHVTSDNGTVHVNQESYKLVDTNKITMSNYNANTLSIPSWIKQDAMSWSGGSISDTQFVAAIQYLVANKTMAYAASGSASLSVLIPSWIKSDARFWSSGQLSDREFAGAMQYLVSHGIIRLPDAKSGAAVAGFPTGKVRLGDIYLDVDVADTPQRQTQGLQGHSVLSYAQGMLFPFAQPQIIPIWMKDMQFPIDIIWFDSSGKIVHVEKDVPPCTTDTCTIYGDNIQAKYVLEVASGFVDKFGITTSSILQVLSP